MRAQLRDHLIHLGQDREGPRGAYELHLKGEQIFFRGGGRREGTYSSEWNRCTGWRLMGVLSQGRRDGN